MNMKALFSTPQPSCMILVITCSVLIPLLGVPVDNCHTAHALLNSQQGMGMLERVSQLSFANAIANLLVIYQYGCDVSCR